MTAVCLLVEDDTVTRRIISNFLSSCSYEVIEASNGRIALEILESPQGDVVDIILTDNKMPEIKCMFPGEMQALHSTQPHLGLEAQVTGLELIVRLVQTQQWQHLPVVIMSSEMREDVVQQAMAAGACGFLHKPVKRTEINALWKHAERSRKRQKVSHQDALEAGQSAATGSKVTLSVQQYEPGMSSLMRMPDQDPEPSTASLTAEGHGQSHPGPTSWPPLPVCTTASILGSCSQPMTGGQLLEIKPLNLESAASISSSTSMALRSLLPTAALEGDRSLQIRSTPPLFGSSALFAQPQQMLCHASQAVAFQRLQTKEASTAHRQAAIARFRAKRTARSFEKRVRYANRQKLAVIRPRVKGQFCRAPSETPDGAKDAKEACTEAVVAA